LATVQFDAVHDFEWALAGEQNRILALVYADEVFEDSQQATDPEEPAGPTRLKIVTNWFTELNKIVPVNGN